MLLVGGASASLRVISYTYQRTGSTTAFDVAAKMGMHLEVHGHQALKIIAQIQNVTQRGDTCVIVTQVRNPIPQARSLLFTRGAQTQNETDARAYLHRRLAECKGCESGALPCAAFDKGSPDPTCPVRPPYDFSSKCNVGNEFCNFNFWSSTFAWVSGVDVFDPELRIPQRLIEDKFFFVRPKPPKRPCAVFMTRFEEIGRFPDLFCASMKHLDPSLLCLGERNNDTSKGAMRKAKRAPLPCTPGADGVPYQVVGKGNITHTTACEPGFEQRFDWTVDELQMMLTSEHMLFYTAAERHKFLANLSSPAARDPQVLRRINHTTHVLNAITKRVAGWRAVSADSVPKVNIVHPQRSQLFRHQHSTGWPWQSLWTSHKNASAKFQVNLGVYRDAVAADEEEVAGSSSSSGASGGGGFDIASY